MIFACRELNLGRTLTAAVGDGTDDVEHGMQNEAVIKADPALSRRHSGLLSTLAFRTLSRSHQARNQRTSASTALKRESISPSVRSTRAR